MAARLKNRYVFLSWDEMGWPGNDEEWFARGTADAGDLSFDPFSSLGPKYPKKARRLSNQVRRNVAGSWA